MQKVHCAVQNVHCAVQNVHCAHQTCQTIQYKNVYKFKFTPSQQKSPLYLEKKVKKQCKMCTLQNVHSAHPNCQKKCSIRILRNLNLRLYTKLQLSSLKNKKSWENVQNVHCAVQNVHCAHPNCQKIQYQNTYEIQIHACTLNYSSSLKLKGVQSNHGVEYFGGPASPTHRFLHNQQFLHNQHVF